MTDFNPKDERQLLDSMLRSFESESRMAGGLIAADKLAETISETWCQMTPVQREQVAKVNVATLDHSSRDYPSKFLLDGNGHYAAMQGYTGDSVVPLKCHDK